MGYSQRTRDLLEILLNKKVYLSRVIVAEYIRNKIKRFNLPYFLYIVIYKSIIFNCEKMMSMLI